MRLRRVLVLTCFSTGLWVGACSQLGVEERHLTEADSPEIARVEALAQETGSPEPATKVPAEIIELTREAIEVRETQVSGCEESSGRIETRSYPGYLAGEAVPVIVYLPPCYDPFLQLYPVIILLHGKPQDERHWLLLGVDEVVSQGILSGELPPLLLVMPHQPEPLFSETSGGPGSLEQELLSGLVPFILDRYAVTGEPEGWAIAGISRGGVWALEVGLRNPGRQGRVAALSPALNVNFPNPQYDPFQILLEAEQVPDRIFFGVGDLDSAKNKTLELASRVEAMGITSSYLEVAGTHESATWKELIPEMLAFLTLGW